MQIGDLVKFNDLAEPFAGKTGVIVRSQTDEQIDEEWFEILSDGQLIVAPEHQVTLLWTSH